MAWQRWSRIKSSLVRQVQKLFFVERSEHASVFRDQCCHLGLTETLYSHVRFQFRGLKSLGRRKKVFVGIGCQEDDDNHDDDDDDDDDDDYRNNGKKIQFLRWKWRPVLSSDLNPSDPRWRKLVSTTAGYRFEPFVLAEDYHCKYLIMIENSNPTVASL